MNATLTVAGVNVYPPDIEAASLWPAPEFPKTPSLKIKRSAVDLLARMRSVGGNSADLPRVSWARSVPVRFVRGMLQHILNAGLRAVVRLEVKDRDKLSGLVTPAIFAANHTSHLDSPTVLRSLPSRIRAKTACAAAADFFFGIGRDPSSAKRPIHRILSVAAPLLVNAFPFCRQGQIRKSMRLLGQMLDDGWSVLIYPEGTRSTTGEMAPFKPGIGLIAAAMGVPIVPVKIDGLGEILPKGRLIPRPGTARITFGTPMVFDGDSDCAAISARITTAVKEL